MHKCLCDKVTHAGPHDVIKGILDRSYAKYKDQWDDGGGSTDGRHRRDSRHHIGDQLDQDEDQEVGVGHSGELLQEVAGKEGDQIVLGSLDMVVLEEGAYVRTCVCVCVCVHGCQH